METTKTSLLEEGALCFLCPDSGLTVECLERVGGGAFGSVYRARIAETGSLLAVKVSNASTASKAAGSPACFDDLTTEFQHLQRLRHPHIVHVYSLLSATGSDSSLRMGMTLELGAVCLHNFLQSNPLRVDSDGFAAAVAQRGRAVAQLLSGLVYLASRRVLHADIKPGNVVLFHQDVAKLTDFGLARSVPQSGLQVHFQELFSKPYRPLELLASTTRRARRLVSSLVRATQCAFFPCYVLTQAMVTLQADVHAFGCLLYDMLALDGSHLLVLEPDHFHARSVPVAGPLFQRMAEQRVNLRLPHARRAGGLIVQCTRPPLERISVTQLLRDIPFRPSAPEGRAF